MLKVLQRKGGIPLKTMGIMKQIHLQKSQSRTNIPDTSDSSATTQGTIRISLKQQKGM